MVMSVEWGKEGVEDEGGVEAVRRAEVKGEEGGEDSAVTLVLPPKFNDDDVMKPVIGR